MLFPVYMKWFILFFSQVMPLLLIIGFSISGNISREFPSPGSVEGLGRFVTNKQCDNTFRFPGQGNKKNNDLITEICHNSDGKHSKESNLEHSCVW